MTSTCGTFLKFSLLSVLTCFSAACSIDASILKELSSANRGPRLERTVSLYVGESTIISPEGGTPPFIYRSASSGFLDTTTGLYQLPTNADVVAEDIEVVDSAGITFDVKIQRKGFSEFSKIALPVTIDSDIRITDAVWLTSGQIIATGDSEDRGGRHAATYRSLDDGVSWERVDHYILDYLRDSPLALWGA